MCEPQVRFRERPGGESPRAYSTGDMAGTRPTHGKARWTELAGCHLGNLVKIQAPRQQVLLVAFTGCLQPAELLIDLDDPHLRNRAFTDLGKPLPFLRLEFDVAGDLEQLGLRVVDVFTHQPKGEEPATRPDRVARKRMDLRHDAHSRRCHAAVRHPRPVRDLARDDDRSPVVRELRGARDQLEVLLRLRAQLEHLGQRRRRRTERRR